MKILSLWRFYVASCIENHHKIAAKIVFSRWIFYDLHYRPEFPIHYATTEEKTNARSYSSPYIALVRENMVL